MARWLQSGRRRDLCIILADEGEAQAQRLKTRLADRYDERIEPKTFRRMLSALVESGYVETRTEGIHDVYRLTDVGRARLEEHRDWLESALE